MCVCVWLRVCAGTPLHVAVQSGSIVACEALLTAAANLQAALLAPQQPSQPSGTDGDDDSPRAPPLQRPSLRMTTSNLNADMLRSVERSALRRAAQVGALPAAGGGPRSGRVASCLSSIESASSESPRDGSPPRILMYALRELHAGDELEWDYGKGYWDAHAGKVE